MAGYVEKLDADCSADYEKMYILKNLNSIAGGKKVSVFTVTMGNVTVPVEPAELSFSDIVETMQNHL